MNIEQNYIVLGDNNKFTRYCRSKELAQLLVAELIFCWITTPQMKCPYNNKLMVAVPALLMNKDFERKLYELIANKDFDGLYNQWNRVVSESADYDHLLLKIVNPKEFKPINTFDALATGASNILKSL